MKIGRLLIWKPKNKQTLSAIKIKYNAQRIIKTIKKRTGNRKKRLTKELRSFAKKDSKIKGNWKSKFPFFGNDRSHKDESAREIGEYATRLSVEHTLETRLKNIDDALEKMKRSNYGNCENCQNEIEEKRLKAIPEAKTCFKCGEKNQA